MAKETRFVTDERREIEFFGPRKLCPRRAGEPVDTIRSFRDWHQRRPGRHPPAVVLHEYAEHSRLVRDGDLAVGIRGLENCMIRRQRYVPVHGHQLEVLRVGSSIPWG